MKPNKIFSIITIFFLLNTVNKSFSMEKIEKIKSNEKFIEFKDNKINLKHKGWKAISENGNYVASGSDDENDGSVIVWNTIKDKKVCSYKHDNNVNNILYVSNDGNHVVSGTGYFSYYGRYDQVKCVLWDTRNNKKINSYKQNDLFESKLNKNGKNNFVLGNCVTLGSHVVAWGFDGVVVIYKSLSNCFKRFKYLNEYKHNFVNHACFSPDKKYIASVSGSCSEYSFHRKRKVKVWDIEKNKKIFSYFT